MYERFTDRARKTLQLANQTAQKLNHEYVGAEHILIGLTKEGSGMASRIFEDLGVNTGNICDDVAQIPDMKPGSDVVTMGKLPHTPRAKQVTECAIAEAKRLQNNYVGTEHLLLGLLRLTDCALTEILPKHIRRDAVYESIERILASGQPQSEAVDPIGPTSEPTVNPSQVQRLALEIMNLTLWQVAALNAALRAYGLSAGLHTATWRFTASMETPGKPE